MRGIYDVSAFRADAEIMFWWHAPTPELIQKAYSAVRRSRLGAALESVWSAMAVHRPSEFSKAHLPALLTDDVAGDYTACIRSSGRTSGTCCAGGAVADAG